MCWDQEAQALARPDGARLRCEDGGTRCDVQRTKRAAARRDIFGKQHGGLARPRTFHRRVERGKRERRAGYDDLANDVQTLAVSAFGLLTASADAAVRVYQLSDRRELFTLRGHRDVVQALAVAPSGEVFASGGADGVVCVWSLACGTWVSRFVASPQ